MSWGRDTKLFVTAPAGTEVALKAELRDLGLSGAKADRGGVRVKGGLDAITRLCARSRLAIRVLIEVGSFAAGDESALYRGVQSIDWSRWLTPDRTLAVRAVSKSSRLTHTGFLAQKTKDAIVDGQRRQGGERSSVDKRDPDVSIFLRIDKDRATVHLDASGSSLHRRGWRADAMEAPLKENLAAAMLRLSGWDRERPLVDPFCGSGTIPIEADLWARVVPAQSAHRRFGFERWSDHDEDARARVRGERERGAARQVESGPECSGSDRDEAAVRVARANAKRAVSRAVFETRDIRQLRLDAPSHIVANPPYGERLEAEESWALVGEALGHWRKKHFVTVLTPEEAPFRQPKERPLSDHALHNGPLPCRLLTWAPR